MDMTRETRTNNSLYTCAYCNKNYVRKSAYTNHLIKCKYATKHYKSNSVPLETMTLESLSRDVKYLNTIMLKEFLILFANILTG